MSEQFRMIFELPVLTGCCEIESLPEPAALGGGRLLQGSVIQPGYGVRDEVKAATELVRSSVPDIPDGLLVDAASAAAAHVGVGEEGEGGGKPLGTSERRANEGRRREEEKEKEKSEM
ncbi:hypothetical protein PRIPAC_71752 [Pristionchus pacificus]|uniref:Uncharacterized protein n=1 Tax=Pristionchus pacificus TaxID=54126 RepID=A0A2A6CT62_PRIPA|nr:hypothetical protein PRIPAC_71752 [Pristionchus pacificus]|eukprot:PDM81329.1 hypothetical protein PRIPAC_36332 [Pristionchus pacificus]